MPRILAGDGAHIVFAAAQKEELENITLAPENLRFQDAVGVANVAEVMYNSGRCVSAEELLPIYLRLPQAERELRAKKDMGENK
jgi:tRNA threonylcarbamoyladenosine biosynthesis protein TsaB